MKKISDILMEQSKDFKSDHVGCSNCGGAIEGETELDICHECEEALKKSHKESDFEDDSDDLDETELSGIKAVIETREQLDEEMLSFNVNEEIIAIIISATLPSFNIDSTENLAEEDKDAFWKEVDRLKNLAHNYELPQNENVLDEAYDTEISRIVTAMLKLRTNCKNEKVCKIITKAVDSLKEELTA